MRKSSRRVTLIEVADRAGVSPATVSNAVNGTRYVDAETKKRVDKAIADLGYVPNIRARRLRTGKANTIAVFSSMPFAVSAGPSRLGFMMEIAATAAVAALEAQLSLILVPPVPIGHAGAPDLEIDGALVIEPSADDPYLTSLMRRGVPTVAIGRPAGADHAALPYVDLQSRTIAETALDHFAHTGARSIAILVGRSDRMSYHDTETAYRRFAAVHGMPALVYRLDEKEGETAGYEVTREILREHPEVDALFVLVDTFASGAVRALKEAGRRLPGDMRVATRYDGIRARESQPQLTAFNLHLDDLARIGLERLLGEMNGQGGEAVLKGPRPEIVVRESSASGS